MRETTRGRRGAIVLLCLGLAACAGSSTTTPTPTPSPTPTPTPMPSGPGPEATILCDHDEGLRWVSTDPLLSPVSDATHPLVSIKDPSIVFVDGRWHLYATTANTSGSWSMVYLSFADWDEAARATPYYLDAHPDLRGYHCAPQVFYFRPQQKWYLIFQSQQPQYSTADDLSRPETWSTPRDFFQGKPASVVGLWIDYWIICDATNAYLFFTNDAGYFYRSQTSLSDFPNGFTEPVIVMRDADRANLFEAGHVYRMKGTSQYLAIIEGWGGTEGRRYYRAFVADQLDGGWTPALNTSSWEQPFAGLNNVTFENGATGWTRDISHGELLREGYDERLIVDPCNLRLLYQGYDPDRNTPEYSQLPWQLALLRLAP